MRGIHRSSFPLKAAVTRSSVCLFTLFLFGLLGPIANAASQDDASQDDASQDQATQDDATQGDASQDQASQEGTDSSDAPSSALDEQLNEVREGIAKAYNDGDVDALLTYCHQDVIAVWQNGEVAVGHDGMREVIRQLVDDDNRVIKEFTAEPTVENRQVFADGATVVSMGKMNDTYTLTRPDGTQVSLDSHWTATLSQIDGKWMVVSFHASTNAFDNEVISLFTTATRWTAGLGGGVIGIVIGVVIGFLMPRRKNENEQQKS